MQMLVLLLYRFVRSARYAGVLTKILERDEPLAPQGVDDFVYS
jgi:hypothetical protein